jgi:hypothetical protein
LAAALTLAFASLFALAYPPTYFMFTPHLKEPDPGKRIWEKKPPCYVETLPSGRKNAFRIQKETTLLTCRLLRQYPIPSRERSISPT